MWRVGTGATLVAASLAASSNCGSSVVQLDDSISLSFDGLSLRNELPQANVASNNLISPFVFSALIAADLKPFSCFLAFELKLDGAA